MYLYSTLGTCNEHAHGPRRAPHLIQAGILVVTRSLGIKPLDPLQLHIIMYCVPVSSCYSKLEEK